MGSLNDFAILFMVLLVFGAAFCMLGWVLKGQRVDIEYLKSSNKALSDLVTNHIIGAKK